MFKAHSFARRGFSSDMPAFSFKYSEEWVIEPGIEYLFNILTWCSLVFSS